MHISQRPPRTYHPGRVRVRETMKNRLAGKAAIHQCLGCWGVWYTACWHKTSAIRTTPERSSGRQSTIKGRNMAVVKTRFQARSKDLRGGRWSWTFKLAQKRSWVGRWSWAAKVGLPSLRAVRQHIVFVTLPKHSSWNSNCALHKSLGNGEGTPP